MRKRPAAAAIGSWPNTLREPDAYCVRTAWNAGAGEGNRTLVFSLEGCCSTIELHPRTLGDTQGGPRPQAQGRVEIDLRYGEGGGRGRTRTYEGLASGFTDC